MMARTRVTLFALLVPMAVLSACKDKEKTQASAVSAPAGAIQITADEKGFTPSSVTLKKGAPGKLVFLRTTDETCATEVVFPELAIKKDLPKGQPVTIEIPTDKDQKLTFQCGMGMYKSSVVVN
jgi:plastocyanin domain-containing protein